MIYPEEKNLFYELPMNETYDSPPVSFIIDQLNENASINKVNDELIPLQSVSIVCLINNLDLLSNTLSNNFIWYDMNNNSYQRLEPLETINNIFLFSSTIQEQKIKGKIGLLSFSPYSNKIYYIIWNENRSMNDYQEYTLIDNINDFPLIFQPKFHNQFQEHNKNDQILTNYSVQTLRQCKDQLLGYLVKFNSNLLSFSEFLMQINRYITILFRKSHLDDNIEENNTLLTIADCKKLLLVGEDKKLDIFQVVKLILFWYRINQINQSISFHNNSILKELKCLITLIQVKEFITVLQEIRNNKECQTILNFIFNSIISNDKECIYVLILFYLIQSEISMVTDSRCEEIAILRPQGPLVFIQDFQEDIRQYYLDRLIQSCKSFESLIILYNNNSVLNAIHPISKEIIIQLAHNINPTNISFKDNPIKEYESLFYLINKSFQVDGDILQIIQKENYLLTLFDLKLYDYLPFSERLSMYLDPIIKLQITKEEKTKHIQEFFQYSLSEIIRSPEYSYRIIIEYCQTLISNESSIIPVLLRELNHPNTQLIAERIMILCHVSDEFLANIELLNLLDILKQDDDQLTISYWLFNFIWENQNLLLINQELYSDHILQLQINIWNQILNKDLRIYSIKYNSTFLSLCSMFRLDIMNIPKPIMLVVGMLSSKDVFKIIESINNQLLLITNNNNYHLQESIEELINPIFQLFSEIHETLLDIKQRVHTPKELFWKDIETLHNLMINQRLNNVNLFQPSYDLSDVILDQYNYYQSIITDWEKLKELFVVIIPQHNYFKELSFQYAQEIEEQCKNMKSGKLIDWHKPTILSEQYFFLAKRFVIAQKSSIYKYIWNHEILKRPNHNSNNMTKEDQLFQWKLCVEKTFEEWISLMKKIANKSCDIQILGKMLTINYPSFQYRDDDIQNVQLNYFNHLFYLIDIQTTCINNEMKIIEEMSFDGLVDILQHNADSIKDSLIEFYGIWRKNKSFCDLKELLLILNTPFAKQDPLIEYCSIISTNCSLEKYFSDYNKMIEKYPTFQFLIFEFTTELLLLIKEDERYGFLTLLQRFVNVHLLTQTINRLINEIEPKHQSFLISFQKVRDHFALASIDQYTLFANRSIQNIDLFLEYLSEISWGIHYLKVLNGGILSLLSIFDGGISTTTAMASARALLYGGIFSFSLESGEILGQGTMPNNQIKQFTSQEIFDIPYQLCLVGNDVSSNEDKLHEERRHFMLLMERLLMIHEIFKKLKVSGHPGFQIGSINIPGSIQIDDLFEQLKEYKLRLHEWEVFLSEINNEYPILTCLTQKQLVNCFYILTKDFSLVNLSKVLSIILLLQDQPVSLKAISTNPKTIHSEYESAILLNELLKENFILSSKTMNINIPLPESLKQSNLINLLLFQEKQRNDVVGCLLCIYLLLLKRFPSQFEMIFCTSETTKEEINTFLGRWVKSKEFTKDKMLFTMINIASLNTFIQNIVLEFLFSNANESNNQLILVSIIDSNQESTPLLVTSLSNYMIGGINNLLTGWSQSLRPLIRKNFPNIFIMKSTYACSGKTNSIIRNHCLPPFDRIIVTIPLSNNLDEFIELYSQIQHEYENISIPQNEKKPELLIHINITNDLSVEIVDNFILQFIFLNCLFDSQGKQVIRNLHYIIVFELPSEGSFLEKKWSANKFMNCFTTLSPALRIDSEEMQYISYRNSLLLYTIQTLPNNNFLIGLKLAYSFFQALENQSLRLPFKSTLDAMELPDPEALYKYFESNFKNTFDKSTSPPNIIYRRIKFFTNQLFGLSQLALYESCEFYEQSSYATKLSFYFAKTSYELSIKLAGESFESASDDEAKRMEKLSLALEDWGELPFLIFENGSFEVVDMNLNEESIEDNFLQKITQDDTESGFKRYVNLQSKPKVKSILHMLSKLGDSSYNPLTEENDDALKRLIPLLSNKSNYGRFVFHALEILRFEVISEDTILPVNKFESACKELETALDIQILNSRPITVKEFYSYANQWFQSILGSYDDPNSIPFVLTLTNLVRMLAIKVRLACKFPLVFIGETGCGKTKLVSYFCKITGSKHYVINIHGGMTAKLLLKDIKKIIHENKSDSNVVVLLDEANSMPSVWTIKELICDHVILGYRIPDFVIFICIMNPYKYRKHTIDKHGLNFLTYSNKANSSFIKEDKPLYYQVYKSPESLLLYAWDYGLPNKSLLSRNIANLLCHDRTPYPHELEWVSEETIMTENMVHWLVESHLLNISGLSEDFKTLNEFNENKTVHFKFLRILLCVLIDFSLTFLRNLEGDVSAVSLRDIYHTITKIPFYIQLQERMAIFDPSIKMKEIPYFHFLCVSIQASFVFNFTLRLENEKRMEYLNQFHEIWKKTRLYHRRNLSDKYLSTPKMGIDIYKTFDYLAKRFCGYLSLDPGIAINEALKENVFSLFSTIVGKSDIRPAQFIVGRPGSTKSYSLEILCSSMDPTNSDPRTRFFKNNNNSNEESNSDSLSPVSSQNQANHNQFNQINSFKIEKIDKFVLQCTPDTKAIDIERLALKAASFQRRMGNKSICILVLEEVGVTIGSKHNPLMALHGLIDRGVLMEDGEYIRLPIIGISNWYLDASKMSRMRIAYRGSPTITDLIMTAKSIIDNYKIDQFQFYEGQSKEIFYLGLDQFAKVIHEYLLEEKCNNTDKKELSRFYGLRDFYAFIQMVQFYRIQSLNLELGFPDENNYQLSPDMIRWAAKVNFGGHPDARLEKILLNEIEKCFFPDGVGNQLAIWSVKECTERLNFSCDMCARIQFYHDLRIRDLHQYDFPARGRHFTEKFEKPSSVINCDYLESLSFHESCLNVISYSLNVYNGPGVFKNLYRIRHLLLFTRADSSILQLLYTLKIIKPGETFTIFGRINPKASEILEDLLNVRRCMITGGTLILLKAQHIYESLYDALNQHYWVEGQGEDMKYFTRLTMNGYTASFPIHSHFRTILVEHESASNTLLPPFLNRLVKSNVNFDAILSKEQKRLLLSVSQSGQLLYENNQTSNLFFFLIPGFSDDSLLSLVSLYSNYSEENVENIKYILFQLFCPRRILQLKHGLIPGFSDSNVQTILQEWLKYDIQLTDSTIESKLNHLYKIDNNMETENILIFTEQRKIDWKEFHASIQNVFPEYTLINEHIQLNNISNYKEISDYFDLFYQYFDPSICFAILDLSGDQSNNLLEIYQRFLYSISNRSKEMLEKKKIILICFLPNSCDLKTSHKLYNSDKSSSAWKLIFNKNWQYLFIDELVTKARNPLNYIYDLSSFFSEKSDSFKELLTINQFCQLIQLRSVSIAQKLSPLKDSRNIENFQNLLLDIFSIDALQKNILPYLLYEKILLQISNETYFTPFTWIQLALQQVFYEDSLRFQLTLYLAYFIEKCFVKYANIFFSFYNYRHQFLPKTSDIFFQLLTNKFIFPEQDLSLCAMIDLTSPLIPKLLHHDDSSSLFENRSIYSSFPFSSIIYQIIQPLSLRLNHEIFIQRLQELELYDIDIDLILLYVHDVLYHKGLVQSTQQDIFLRVVKVLFHWDPYGMISESFSLGSLHCLFNKHSKNVEALIQYLLIENLNIDILLMDFQSIEILEERLLDALPTSRDNSSIGLLSLDWIVYIELILNHQITFKTILCRALVPSVSILTCDELILLKQSVVLSNSLLNVVNELFYQRIVVFKILKLVLPVLFDLVEKSSQNNENNQTRNEAMISLFSNLFGSMDFFYSYFNEESIKYILLKLFNYWSKDQKSNVSNYIFPSISPLFSHPGFSLLFSRSIYTYLDSYNKIKWTFDILQQMDQIDIKKIIHIALLTSSIEFFAKQLQEGIKEEMNMNKEKTKKFSRIINQLIDNNTFNNIDNPTDLFILEGGTLNFLRSISCSGLEIDLCRNILNVYKDYIPDIMYQHVYTQELLVQINSTDDNPFLLLEDYQIAKSLLNTYFSDTPISDQSRELLLDRFAKMNLFGLAASLLDNYFIVEENHVSQELFQRNIPMLLNILSIHPLLFKFTSTVICQRDDLPNMLKDFSNIKKRAWIGWILTICKQRNSFTKYFYDILESNQPKTNTFTLKDSPFLQYCLTATQLAHLVLHPLRPLTSREQNKVVRHVEHIIDTILTARCPNCHIAFDYFTGCFSVKCDCGIQFCGWCFENCGRDAHPHVKQCQYSLTNGNYYGTEENYRQAQKLLKTRWLLSYFQNHIENDLSAHILDQIAIHLKNHNIALDGYGNLTTYPSLMISVQFDYICEIIKKAIFPNASNVKIVFQYIEAIYYLLLDEVPCQPLLQKDINCQELYLKLIEPKIKQYQGPVLLDTLSQGFPKKSTLDRSLLNKLTWNQVYETEIQHLSSEIRYFELRLRLKETDIFDLLEQNPKFSFLQYLHQNQDNLEPHWNAIYVRVFVYLQKIFDYSLTIQMSRAKAKITSLFEFIQDMDYNEYHEKYFLLEEMDQFVNDMQYIFNRIDQYQCKTKDELYSGGIFEELTFTRNIPLIYILPDNGWVEGVLPHMLYKGVSKDSTWKSFAFIHNTIVEQINLEAKTYLHHAINPISFQGFLQLNESDLIFYHENDNLIDRLSLFISVNNNPQWTSDIELLQTQIFFLSNISIKGKLPDELPLFPFIEDRKQSIIKEINNAIEDNGLDLIPLDIEMKINEFKLNNPRFAPCCLSFIELLIQEISQRKSEYLPQTVHELIELISIPLTLEQEEGKEYLLTSINGLTAKHLIAFSTLLWNGQVILQASQPLINQEKEDLIQFYKLILNHKNSLIHKRIILFGLRLIGLIHLVETQTENMLQSQLINYFEVVLVNFEETYEIIQNSTLADLPLNHFRDIYQLAIELFESEPKEEIEEQNQQDEELDGELDYHQEEHILIDPQDQTPLHNQRDYLEVPELLNFEQGLSEDSATNSNSLLQVNQSQSSFEENSQNNLKTRNRKFKQDNEDFKKERKQKNDNSQTSIKKSKASDKNMSFSYIFLVVIMFFSLFFLFQSSSSKYR